MQNHETHSCCNIRLMNRGKNAECCFCVPHKNCKFKEKSLKKQIEEKIKNAKIKYEKGKWENNWREIMLIENGKISAYKEILELIK